MNDSTCLKMQEAFKIWDKEMANAFRELKKAVDADAEDDEVAKELHLIKAELSNAIAMEQVEVIKSLE